LTIVAPKRSASARAAADLPLAVGPAMRSARLPFSRAREWGRGKGTFKPSSAVVATLIADSRSIRLSDARLARLAQGVGGFDSHQGLDEGAAADLFFTALLDAAHAALKKALPGEPIDVIAQPAAHRKKRLLVADMDSTLIGQEGLDELAVYAGFGERVARITERAMQGEIAFEPALRESRGSPVSRRASSPKC
jgi:phosphoserine phosphatase